MTEEFDPHRRVGSTKEGIENEDEVQSIIENLASHFHTDKTVPKLAISIYRNGIEANYGANYSFQEMAAASFYTAIRVLELPIKAQEVATKSDTYDRRIKSLFTSLSKELELKVGLTEPDVFIERYVDELNLDDNIELRAKDLLNKSEERNLHSGRSPSAFAAGLIYLAGNLEQEFVSQTQIERETGINRRTIRTIYQAIVEGIFEDLSITELFRSGHHSVFYRRLLSPGADLDELEKILQKIGFDDDKFEKFREYQELLEEKGIDSVDNIDQSH